MNRLIIYISFIAILIIVDSCGNVPTNTEDGKLTVTSLRPPTAWSGDTVTISGRNFGEWGNGSIVSFDTLKVNPVYISEKEVRAVVPYPIEEKVFDVRFYKQKDTAVAGKISIENRMIVTSVEPTKAWHGDKITITGKRFETYPNDFTVLLDSIIVEPSYKDNSTILIKVPTTVIKKSYTITIRKKKSINYV
ncbi:MAG: IPT/TIG domain-containing protein [Ignavibacteriae bacterium]|nr:IPT/TIG domain-containing protein [Ignavibacteriota bacterium]